MKRIAIITLNDFFNYGNRLQNYALYHALERLGENCRVENIWFKENIYKRPEKPLAWRNICRFFANRKGFRDWAFRIGYSRMVERDHRREQGMRDFTAGYIPTAIDGRIRADLDERYDYFVVGSDQIWHPGWEPPEFTYLQFAAPEKRISYAASFGVEYIRENDRAAIIQGLRGMQSISVREDAAADIVRELAGREAQVHIDPVLLLTTVEWENIMRRPHWLEDKKYILVYFLGKMPKKARADLDSIRAESGYDVIELMNPTNPDHYCSTPQEFLYLLQNAEAIFTNSFHGTCFSILFEVPFTFYLQATKDGKHMNSRIVTLMRLFGFADRCVTPMGSDLVDDPLTLDFSDSTAVLQRERERSIDYLSSALGIRRK